MKNTTNSKDEFRDQAASMIKWVRSKWDTIRAIELLWILKYTKQYEISKKQHDENRNQVLEKRKIEKSEQEEKKQ